MACGRRLPAAPAKLIAKNSKSTDGTVLQRKAQINLLHCDPHTIIPIFSCRLSSLTLPRSKVGVETFLGLSYLLHSQCLYISIVNYCLPTVRKF